MAARAKVPTEGKPHPVGVSLAEGGINVCVASRQAETIQFCLFDAQGDREIARIVLPGRTAPGLHHGFIPGVKVGARYGLRAEGPYDPSNGQWFDPAKLLVDPYAVEIDRPFMWRPELGAPRSAALDTAPFVPKAILRKPFVPVAPLNAGPPRVIYEVQAKAFTQSFAKIPAARRGTLAALADPKAIDHFRRLGVDTVEIMPIAAWCDERHLPPLGLSNAWGYNPVTFMAPDPRLAPAGMADVRRTVVALHRAGLKVVLDVVLNHSAESDVEGSTLSFRGLDNAHYYRHFAGETARLVNVTGCGNTLATDREPARTMILDSLRHWANAGFDGFRFDLATVLTRGENGAPGDHGLLDAIAADPQLSRLAMIAEPWDAGEDGYRLGRFPPRWLEWNDRFRDDVRRFWKTGTGIGSLATRLAGSSDFFAGGDRRPSSSVNYVAAHDGFTLRDLVSYSRKHNLANGEGNRDGGNDQTAWNNGEEGPSTDPAVEERRGRDVRALLATLFLSRGTPMLTAGDELGRSQGGNNNAYAQDNETTWLDWTSVDRTLLEYVKGLIAFRNAHPAIGSDRFLTGRPTDSSPFPDIRWLAPSGLDMTEADWHSQASVLGACLDAEGDRVCIWINGAADEVAVVMPDPRPDHDWRIDILSHQGIADARRVIAGARLTLAPRSLTALAEAARRHSRRSRRPDDDFVSRAASAAGITEDWWTIEGEHHHVGIETKRALLLAMGLDVMGSPDDVLKLLAGERELPPMTVVNAGEPGSIRIGRDGSSKGRRRALHLELETGRSLTIDVPDGEGPASVALPPLPEGYHSVRLSTASRARGHLIAAPRAAFVSEALLDGGRTWGLAAHLYALRHADDGGIGDFETLARYGETTGHLGGTVAGINPLHHLFPTDRGRASPYQPSDRRFIDPIYIDVAALSGGHEEADGASLAMLAAKPGVDYDGVWTLKRAALERAFARFRRSPAADEFDSFAKAATDSLRRHAAFETLADAAGTVDRRRWPAALRTHAASAVKKHAARLAEPMEFRLWLQWIADRQLAAAASRARSAGLAHGFYGDLAIGTAPDGGEIWAAPERFATGVSLGAPPDPFAAAGQVWHLTPFRPMALAETGLAPYREILTAAMRQSGVLRIDHVLGFTRQFWVPDGASGSDGAYVACPENAFIATTAIESRRAGCMVVGEDLGTVPDGLRANLAEARLLSYKLLWFERDASRFRSPLDYPHLSACCISSHDLPTFLGWRRSQPDDAVNLKDAIVSSGLSPGDGDIGLMAAAHEMVATAPSALMLVQVDDLFEETEPLNVPGTDRERPNWRRRNAGPIENLSRSETAARVIGAVRRQRGP